MKHQTIKPNKPVVLKWIFSFIVGFCISQAGGWTSASAMNITTHPLSAGYTTSQLDFTENSWEWPTLDSGSYNTGHYESMYIQSTTARVNNVPCSGDTMNLSSFDNPQVFTTPFSWTSFFGNTEMRYYDFCVTTHIDSLPFTMAWNNISVSATGEIVVLSNPIAPEPELSANSCNPFSSSIATAFFNTDFSISQCFSYLFSPSDEVLSQFSALTLQNSAPFSYLYDIDDIFSELFSNSGNREMNLSVTTNIGEIVFLSRARIEAVPYAGFIKTILGYLFYVVTALGLYRLLLKSHD